MSQCELREDSYILTYVSSILTQSTALSVLTASYLTPWLTKSFTISWRCLPGACEMSSMLSTVGKLSLMADIPCKHSVVVRNVVCCRFQKLACVSKQIVNRAHVTNMGLLWLCLLKHAALVTCTLISAIGQPSPMRCAILEYPCGHSGRTLTLLIAHLYTDISYWTAISHVLCSTRLSCTLLPGSTWVPMPSNIMLTQHQGHMHIPT